MFYDYSILYKNRQGNQEKRRKDAENTQEYMVFYGIKKGGIRF